MSKIGKVLGFVVLTFALWQLINIPLFVLVFRIIPVDIWMNLGFEGLPGMFGIALFTSVFSLILSTTIMAIIYKKRRH